MATLVVSHFLWTARGAAQTVGAGADGSVATALRPLRIGYLAAEGGERAATMERLVAALGEDAPLLAALAEAGFGAPVVSPAASLNDLTENMRIGRYAVVFAPLSALRSWRDAAMRVALQQRRPGDLWDSRGQGTRQACVIFRRAETNASPTEGSWAFLGGESSTGYIYPRLYLLAHDRLAEPRDPLIRRSAEEVYYAVINGLRDYGAMDHTTFDRLERAHAERAAAQPLPRGYRPVRLAPTPIDAVPSDPVLFARDLSLAADQAGARLRAALREYSLQAPDTWPHELVYSDDSHYAKAREDIELFYSLLDTREHAPHADRTIDEAAPGANGPRPRRTPTPLATDTATTSPATAPTP